MLNYFITIIDILVLVMWRHKTCLPIGLHMDNKCCMKFVHGINKRRRELFLFLPTSSPSMKWIEKQVKIYLNISHYREGGPQTQSLTR